jgi:hypothetical protein
VSHLCDTIGCLSKEHLCIESAAINNQRSLCQGILLHVHEITAGEFLIMQVNPCDHDEKHPDANGDYFKYSCRKIQAIIIDKDDFF